MYLRLQFDSPVLPAILALGVVLGAMTISTDAKAQEEVLEDVRAQGVHYYKRGRYKQARKELERARGMKGGDTDPLTIIFLAKTYEGLRRLDKAFPLARRSTRLTGPNTPLGKRSRGLLNSLRNAFGEVKVESDVASGALTLKTQARFINRAKREHFRSTQGRLSASESVFPLRLYLPHGDYSLNDIRFSVEPNRDSAQIVQVPSSRFVQSSSSTSWMYITGGVAAAVAAGVSTWLILSSEADDPTPGFSHRVVIESDQR